jgi:hypothetical protein
MYIYDRKLSGSRSQGKEQPITPQRAQRNSYHLGRVISGSWGRRGSSGSYVWTNEGLEQLSADILLRRHLSASIGSIAEEVRRCVSPPVSSNDPTALKLSLYGTSDFNATLSVRGTSYQVKGNVFYPEQFGGGFNTRAVAEGKAPIVFIVHGQHATFHNPRERMDEVGTDNSQGEWDKSLGRFLPIANYRGYEYFQKLLAQMGIISVSVDCNQFGGHVGGSQTFINSYADLVLGAIKHFQSLNSGRDPTFGGHIDFSSVGLMGHSRGGEAVLLVPELLALPSTGISGVTVKGVLAIAPTDTGATSGTRTGFAFMTILPAADLDLFSNEGARLYDQASADPFKCQLYVHDANHNFFNEQWISDDRDTWNTQTRTVTRRRSHITLMGKDEQKAILKAYGCAFFRTVLHRHNRPLAGHHMRKFLEGLEIPPGVTRFRDVHISFERTGSTTVDDNEHHDIRRNTRGQTNTWAGGLTAQRCEFSQTGCQVTKQVGRAITRNKPFYGNTRGMVAWSSLKSGRFKWLLGGTMDLRGREIRIRAAEVYHGSSVPVGATGFKLGLADARDKRGFVDSDDVGGLPRPYDRRADDFAIFERDFDFPDFTKTMLKTLRFPVACIVARAEPSFDPTKVRAIVLWMDRNDGRALAFDQLQIV